MAQVTPQEVQEQLEALKAALEQDRRTLKELEVLQEQAAMEVQRLEQRLQRGEQRLKHARTHPDQYPPEDLLALFDTLLDLTRRTLEAQAQLEFLRKRQELLRERVRRDEGLVRFLEETAEAWSRMGTEARADEEKRREVRAQMRVRERELLRVSRAIHDGPTQALSNLVLRAEVCQRILKKDPGQAEKELEGLKTAVTATLQEMRDFIFELRPMVLDDLGLIPTLRRFVQRFGERHGLEISLMLSDLKQRLPTLYEEALFRFVQEALVNVVRHAHATEVRISLDVEGRDLVLTVEDNGIGFEVESALRRKAAEEEEGVGLSHMRQLIEYLLDGRMEIDSQPGKGTRVLARVPLPAGF